MSTQMRRAATSLLLFMCSSVNAVAEHAAINQNAWLNYVIIVNSQKSPSEVSVVQHGSVNGMSSVQLAGQNDAIIGTRQNGAQNTSVIYQSGWNTISSVAQGGPNGFSGHGDLPTTYWVRKVDEGYLSYFMTGGFSLATLTDSNHTWFSRFGRSR